MTRAVTRAVIAGVGQTEFSARSGRSEARLAVEAVLDALADARLDPASVDGLVTFAHDSTHEITVARNLGLDGLSYTGRTTYGGTDYCTTVLQARLAVEAGLATTVVCYRAFNERSGMRFGRGFGEGFGAFSPGLSDETDQWSLSVPFGLRTAAGWIGMYARRMMHEHGLTSADLAEVSVAARAHAATNPAARFYRRPITTEDHQESRMIVEPLRLLDCCLETDGGAAVVVTTEDRARETGRPYAVIAGVATAAGPDQHLMASYYRPDILDFGELTRVADQVWNRAGLGPADIDVAVLYDHFTPMVLAQLEAWGFCERGEAKEFVRDGNIRVGGRLPVNPHGGQLGEAYLHGMNGINEAVRQLRGEAANQVPGARHVLVSAPPGTPSSGMILTMGAT
ncbi:MAG: lipid-transfer protein [Nocardioidaceae bacterium]|nr:lipid-transfer protein [Nocardioidaceae bacterium]